MRGVCYKRYKVRSTAGRNEEPTTHAPAVRDSPGPGEGVAQRKRAPTTHARTCDLYARKLADWYQQHYCVALWDFPSHRLSARRLAADTAPGDQNRPTPPPHHATWNGRLPTTIPPASLPALRKSRRSSGGDPGARPSSLCSARKRSRTRRTCSRSLGPMDET